MKRRLSLRKMAALQKDLWLAELCRETDESLLITLAGDGRVLAFDLEGIEALAIAYESLDPWVMPSELSLSRPLKLEATLDFEPDDEIAARLVELSADHFADILAASQVDWVQGSLNNISESCYLLDLRVENWTSEPHRSDLHILIAVQSILAVDDDALDLSPGKNEGLKADSGEIEPQEGPQEPAFDLMPHDLPERFLRPLKQFFEAQLADDFETLCKIWPSHDLDHDAQMTQLQRHYHNLEDWGYARMVEAWKEEGDLAAVRLRGLSYSAPEAGIRSLVEECVWTFSLRKRGDDYLIRLWSRGWPSVGGAERLDEAAKPWLKTWSSGPIMDD